MSIDRARSIADTVPGLHWKMLLVNTQEKELAGIYMFRDEQSLEKCLHGPLFAVLR